jgi:hypothetical protein
MKELSERLLYKVVVTDKDGRVLAVQEAEARSFLKAYNQILSSCMGAANRTIKDTGGTDRTVIGDGTVFGIGAAATVVLYGIRVGTGNSAVTISDYALETPIAEGTGDGQMSHLIMQLSTDVTLADPICTSTLTRVMVNNGSTTITVREIGIYAICRQSDTTYRYFCIVRDVLGSSVSVPAGGAITVIYTWKITE